MNTEAVNQEYQTVTLSQLTESLTNPRKTFDYKALNEMAESIRAVGLLQPILVRPTATEGRFEIVAGARRFRAARLAEVESVSVRVCQLTDAQALEAQVIENLTRAPFRIDESGKRVFASDSYEWTCPKCNSQCVTGNTVQGFISEHKCGAKCLSAIGPNCECSCGGTNHGTNWL
jgi:hypothetical protein